MAIPKKYQLKNQLNNYGNLDNQPSGWVTFSDAKINMHSKHHRDAVRSNRIYTYEVLRGFDGGFRRYGWKPILESIIHKDQLPLFRRLIAKSKAASKKAAKVKAKARARLLKTPEYRQDLEARRQKRRDAAAALKARNAEKEIEDQRLNLLCREVGIRADKAGRLLAHGLRDIKEAHPHWLKDAYEAVLDGERYNGIMKQYLCGELDQLHPSDAWIFYHDLRIAIRAHRRHRDTDYDQLLDEGFDRDEARSFCTLNDPRS